MLNSNAKSHRSHIQNIQSAGYQAKTAKGPNCQSQSNMSMPKQYLNVPKHSVHGGVKSVSGDSAKTSPSTDNSRDNSQPREFETGPYVHE